MPSEVLQFNPENKENETRITAVRVEDFSELSEALDRGAQAAILRTSMPQLKQDGFWGKEVATGFDDFTSYIAFRDKETALKFQAGSARWALDLESAKPYICFKGEGANLKAGVEQLKKVFGNALDYDDSGMFMFGPNEENTKVKKAAA